MPKYHPPETRLKLRSLYVHGNFTLESAAEQMQISKRSAMRWKNQALSEGDDWDRARLAHLISQEGRDAFIASMVDGFVTANLTCQRLIAEAPDMSPMQRVNLLASLADSFAKVMRAQERAQPDVNRQAVAMEVMEHLLRFVREQYPKHSGVLLEIYDPFAVEINNVYS
jgi:hypothetical protein